MNLNKRIAMLIPVLLLSAGCYGGKMIKMPINTELAYLRVDTLRVRQDEVIRILNEISVQLEEDREANMLSRAQSRANFEEMEESLEILSNQIDANTQLLAAMRGTKQGWNPPPRVIAERDTTASSQQATDGGLPDSAGKSPSIGEGDADKLFNEAYTDLSLGNYDLAIQGFKNYLVKFSGGARLPEVHYYLGESYYASERHLEAVGEFQYIVREFADSRLVPAALLKSGICYASLEERSLAERAFRELISSYPDSEEAERARIALQDLEG
ncbi:MAG: tetratricopeptide repeat protein [Candidatus Latescibacterota bacterium]